MRPQLYVEHGRLLVRLKDPGEAVRIFAEAVRRSPSYLPGYMAMIDAYKDLGMRAAALDAATSGLRNLPGSAPLQKAYLELGGKEPFPAPERVDAEKKPADHFVGGQDKTNEDSVEPSQARKETDLSETKQTDGDVASSAKACRFCPPEEIQKKWRESFGDTPKQ